MIVPRVGLRVIISRIALVVVVVAPHAVVVVVVVVMMTLIEDRGVLVPVSVAMTVAVALPLSLRRSGRHEEERCRGSADQSWKMSSHVGLLRRVNARRPMVRQPHDVPSLSCTFGAQLRW
jgi:hypothetical protein